MNDSVLIGEIVEGINRLAVEEEEEEEDDEEEGEERKKKNKQKKKTKKAKPARDPKVVNLVYSGNFLWEAPWQQTGGILPLIGLMLALGGGHSDEGFHSFTVRVRKPKVTAHFYANGKFILCGARTELECLVQIHRILNLVLRKTGILLHPVQYGISNVVVAYSTGFMIDVELFHQTFADKSKHTPELYQGISYYPNGFDEKGDPKKGPCLVVHVSGAINVVGVRSFETAIDLLDDVNWRMFSVDEPHAPVDKSRSRVRKVRKTAVVI